MEWAQNATKSVVRCTRNC